MPGIQRARAAFAKGNTEEAFEAIFEAPAGRKVKFADFPEPLKKIFMRNAGEFEALVKGDMFPEMDREAVRKIEVPVLLMFGEKSGQAFTDVREELTRVLPEKKLKLIIVQGGEHGFLWSHAKEFQREVLEFLRDK